MTPYLVATRMVGAIYELPGSQHHPAIQWAHLLSGGGINDTDEEAWCSSFVNLIAFIFNLPRSRSKRARSWLAIGEPVSLHDALVGFDVVVMKRGPDPQPGPTVLNAIGHVGFFAGHEDNTHFWLLGGNHSNAVSKSKFEIKRILGVRRLA